MTERGLPPEGAPACPFVAFEDDRDGRSTAPDHRHRCFAEPRPAPRALAHQEAYCLSSAFPVCPTFQDWARREAAAARPATPAAATPRGEPPQSRPMPPLDREGRHVTDTPPPVPPRRSGQRDWAAPPPWSAEQGGTGAGTGAAGAGASEAYGAWADDGAAGGDRPDPDVPQVRDRERPPADWGDESRGLAGSAAHRLAGPDPDEPLPATPEPARYERTYDPGPPRGSTRSRDADLAGSADRDPMDEPRSDEPRYEEPRYEEPRYEPPRYGEPARGDDQDDDEAWAAGAGAGAYVAGTATARGSDASRYAPPSRRQPPAQASRSDRGREGRGSSRDQVRRPQRQEAQELFGPAWEPARRYEAYPTLRTRMGLPGGVPRVAMWALVLVAAAILLFLFGPRLLGLVGGDDGITGGASPTPTVAVETPTPEPTEPPAPTPQVYIVARGDTMSKIARKFGVTVEDIMAANPQIKNPDRIDIGDEITIPVPEAETGFEEESEEP